MKSAYLMIPIAAALVHSIAHYERQGSAARAAGKPASFRSTSPTDTGTDAELVGKVVLDGEAPRNRAINMASDPDCAKSHSGPVTTEEIVVGPENALANVVVYVSEGLDDRTFDPPKEPTVIEQKGCQYHAHVVALQAGQKLLVKNDDPTAHNIHPLPANNREWNRAQAQGVPPIEATFGRQEVAIPVKCNIHPWMKGYIAVFKHPYFAVTDKDGKFILRGLPAGTYTITAWQEKLGTLAQKVSIAPSRTTEIKFVYDATPGR